jgi:1-acyl-sn-glycerol-3-phosphate acyltransferase
MQSRLADIWYDFCYWVCFAAMELAFSLRAEGHGHVPAAGPALLIANHQSFFDPVVAGLAARRRLHFLARKTLFRHWGLSWLMRGLNSIPVDQEGFAREGLKAILEQLQAGHAVLVFPEGNRTPDGKMHPFRPGILLLIKRVAMPIIPVGIAGGYDAWPRHRASPIPAPLLGRGGKGTLAVSIGPPLDSRRLAELPREQVLTELFNAVHRCQEEAERLRRKV